MGKDAEVADFSQYDNVAAARQDYKPTIRKSIGFWVGYAIRGGRECAILEADDDRNEASPQALGGTFNIPSGDGTGPWWVVCITWAT